LLKNSIIQSSPATATVAVTDHPDPVYSFANGEDDGPEEEVSSEEGDSFMFPDAGKLVGSHTTGVNSSEAAWLDSLLEILGDEDEDEFTVDSHASIIPVDDDDDQLIFSPMVSPMSSSDDLPNQSSYPTTVSYTYPVPYPPFHPPLMSSYDSSLSSLPPPYEDPLPYQDFDDLENLSVPDAIEDTSDDESDAPLTPSTNSIDATSVPLPAERSRLRTVTPHIFVGGDDSYFHPFDPLPFPDDFHYTYNAYQEC
jgi:hypothetical protein